LAIDAGFQALGYVIMSVGPDKDQPIFYDAFRTEKNEGRKKGLRVADDDAVRCEKIVLELDRCIQQYQPSGALVELPSGGAQGARANRAMGISTGLTVATMALRKIPCEWLTPSMVKKATAGTNNASKEEVQAGVEKLWGIDFSSMPVWKRSHIADAFGAFLAGRSGVLYQVLRHAS